MYPQSLQSKSEVKNDLQILPQRKKNAQLFILPGKFKSALDLQWAQVTPISVSATWNCNYTSKMT